MQYNAHIVKSSLMYGSSWDRGRFMKNFRFDTIYNITQELQDLHRFNIIVPVGSSASLMWYNIIYFWQKL